MEITFLGTGGVHGVPIWNCDCNTCKSKDPKDNRLRSALFVKIGNKNIVIDFGPDFRTQLLKYDIKQIDYAFLTHTHGDHMNDAMEFSRQKNLILEMPEDVLTEFYTRLQEDRKWLEARNPSMKIRPFRKKVICGVEIDTIALKHQKDYLKKYTPCYGYIFRSKDFSFAYMSDYSEILEKDKLRSTDLIISDGNGFEYSKTGHMGIKGSVDIFKELKPNKMIMTHMNHKKTHNFLTDYVKQFNNISIAYDGLKVTLK